MKKRLVDFTQRLKVSALLIPCVTFIIFFSGEPIVSALLVITMSALAAVGVWEYAQLAIAKGLEPARKLMITVTVCVVVSFYLSLVYPELIKLVPLIIIFGFISFFLAHFRDTTNALTNVAVELFGVCYLAIPFSFMIAILYPFSHAGVLQDGRWWLFYLIAVTKVTDMGGYFAGKLLGKHPLAPQLSPKKTVEGAIGGLLSAVVLSISLSLIAKSLSISSFSLSLLTATWMGLMIGLLAQIGDLAESLLKRDAFVKDSNRLPGIGGVLDMLDSLLFTSPVVYFFIQR